MKLVATSCGHCQAFIRLHKVRSSCGKSYIAPNVAAALCEPKLLTHFSFVGSLPIQIPRPRLRTYRYGYLGISEPSYKVRIRLLRTWRLSEALENRDKCPVTVVRL